MSTISPLGWLSPDGNFYPCQYYEHRAMADIIAGEVYDYYGGLYTGDDYLMQRGWCRISLSMLGNKAYSIEWERFLTDTQKNFLRKYLEDETFGVTSGTKIRWSMEEDL